MLSSDFVALTSSYVTPLGEVIKHVNDGDNRVYLVNNPQKWDGSKNGLGVVGFEDPNKNYKIGDHYQVYDPLREIKINRC